MPSQLEEINEILCDISIWCCWWRALATAAWAGQVWKAGTVRRAEASVRVGALLSCVIRWPSASVSYPVFHWVCDASWTCHFAQCQACHSMQLTSYHWDSVTTTKKCFSRTMWWCIRAKSEVGVCLNNGLVLLNGQPKVKRESHHTLRRSISLS